MFRVHDDLDIHDDGSVSSSKAKMPPLIDLRKTPSLQLVGLSRPDEKEVVDMVSYLNAIFPNTPNEFFEEHADKLVGKPVALEDRLLSDHLSRTTRFPRGVTPSSALIPGCLLQSLICLRWS